MNSMTVITTGLLAIALLCGKSSALLNGFPKERCDDMDPTKIKLEGIPESSDFANSSDPEDAPPASIQQSDSLNLYRIVTSTPKYKRGRTLDITIRGRDYNAFMLQVRKIGSDERRGYDQTVRVGEFVSWPASMKAVSCDKGIVTAITNKDWKSKSAGLTIKWKAPKDDAGDIHVVARFIAGDEYWQLTESREIPLSEFPVNLKNCGKAKSCILYSEGITSCHEDDCDYILTYSVVNNTSVEFVLGGSAKSNDSYLAVGFSKTPEAEKMKFITCARSTSAAEIKFFVLNSMEEGLMEHPMQLENQKMDLDGNRMWCSFIAPMVTQSEDDNGLDLSVPMYQVYMRGTTNSSKSGIVPILPPKLLISKQEISLEKIKLQHHTMDKPKQNNNACVFGGAWLNIVVLILFLEREKIFK